MTKRLDLNLKAFRLSITSSGSLKKPKSNPTSENVLRSVVLVLATYVPGPYGNFLC